MPFRFALEAVFHLRKSLEHQQELRLRTANQQVLGARHLIEKLDERLRRMESERSRALHTGTTASELQFEHLCEEEMQGQRREMVAELSRLERLRDQQQKVLQHARRERETFESLRDKQFADYQRDAARREQRQLDDLFLSRQAYLRRG
ncbi:MAG TPA: flagellar FliJ family protein [Candidatus Solibacter sp.]|nr:flagellar FliJ family protein [Candidatus Solibacter sp.]